MKRTTLAFAVLNAMIGTAVAQSMVTIYGAIDVGVAHENGGAAGSVTKVSSGIGSGSRLGFKGSEDLGGGLSAVFLLENGFQADTGSLGRGDLLFGRQAYVGLKGAAGTVTLGRQYTPQYQAIFLADPFATGTAAGLRNLVPTSGNSAGRMDNSIKYVSPTVNGLSGELAYAAGEIVGNNRAGRQIGAAIDYSEGPLRVRLGYHNRNTETVALKNTSNAVNTVFAATYDLRVVKAHFAYGTDKGLTSSKLRNTANPFARTVAPTASINSSDLLLGVTVPFDDHTLFASYIRKDDKTKLNQDASQFGVGYRYALSKRTSAYANIARITNKNGAGYTVGNTIEAGSGNRSVDLGLRHTF